MSRISPEEQARRAEAARQFSHSTQMSGGRVPPSAEADITAYTRGEIDEAEMLRRARAEYGLPAEHNASAPPSGESECPASGQSVGRMVEIPGSDEWKITCPECGTWWHGGGTLLPRHRRAGDRRAEALRQFRHSTEMEGGHLSDEVEKDLAEFVRGNIDEAELRRRVRSRHDVGD